MSPQARRPQRCGWRSAAVDDVAVFNGVASASRRRRLLGRPRRRRRHRRRADAAEATAWLRWISRPRCVIPPRPSDSEIPAAGDAAASPSAARVDLLGSSAVRARWHLRKKLAQDREGGGRSSLRPPRCCSCRRTPSRGLAGSRTRRRAWLRHRRRSDDASAWFAASCRPPPPAGASSVQDACGAHRQRTCGSLLEHAPAACRARRLAFDPGVTKMPEILKKRQTQHTTCRADKWACRLRLHRRRLRRHVL